MGLMQCEHTEPRRERASIETVRVVLAVDGLMVALTRICHSVHIEQECTDVYEYVPERVDVSIS